ncbi:helix-turn-helix transcriptional regulator [Streptomyces purpurascens]|uniref:helix-turn-helix transcriptional regulator n=1 Tax=Streptomyces purpurascens TaxID=1924 RepID=UPI003C2F1FD9
MVGVPESHTGWTFITSHARVLAAIADNPNVRVRDIAAHCRLTERAVARIIADLEQDGYLSHTRDGRTNTYRIEPDKVLRHPAEAGLAVASLLSLLVQDETERVSKPVAQQQHLVNAQGHESARRRARAASASKPSDQTARKCP